MKKVSLRLSLAFAESLKVFAFTCFLAACSSSQLSEDHAEQAEADSTQAKTFSFGSYVIITSHPNDSLVSELSLFLNDKRVYWQQSSDGYFDTVFQANLNNDGVPDFLVSYMYEDGATLEGLVSQTPSAFFHKILFEEWSEVYCSEHPDSMGQILPLQIKDIDNDGKDDLICNLVKKNDQVVAVSCTDTVFGMQVR